MAVEHFVKVLGAWRSAREPDAFFVKVSGVWRSPQGTDEKFVKVNGQWRSASAAAPPLLPGTYVLAATSISLPTGSQSGFAEFNTVDYRGRITVISIVLSWRNANEAISQIDVGGRPNNNFYRAIENVLREWDGRTITHSISTFDATSLTDFNSGAAIGFNLNSFYIGQRIGNLISNVQLQFVIV